MSNVANKKSDNKEKTLYSIFIVIALVALLSISVVETVWANIGQNIESGIELFSRSYILTHAIRKVILCALPTIMTILFFLLFKTETLIKLSVPFYIMGIIVCSIISFWGFDDEWTKLFGLPIYAPALLYLSIFIISYLVSRYKTYNVGYFIYSVLMIVFIPAIISLVGNHRLSICMTLFIYFMIVSIKLVSDDKLNKKWMMYLGVGIGLFVLSFFMMLITSPDLVQRFNISSSNGTNDPFGSGWMYNNLIKSLKNTPFIGKSTFEVNANEYSTCPAYLYFAQRNSVYLPATLILRFGWIAVIPQLLLVSILIFSIYKLSSKATNNYSKYTAYSVATLFSVRTILGCISCFSFFLNGTYLPFQGDTTSIAIDLVLCLSAIILCNKKQEGTLDLIDKEYPTEGLANYAIEKAGNLSEKITKLFADEVIDDEDEEYIMQLRTQKDELEAAIEKLKIEKSQLEQGTLDLTTLNKSVASTIALTNRIETQEKPRNKVFISYSSNDIKYAEYLCEQLESYGHDCWYAKRDIVADSYATEIVKALKETKIFIVLVTKSSNISKHVCNEVAIAFEMYKDGVTTMPVLLEDVILSDDLQYFLCRQEHAIANTPPIEKQLSQFAKKVHQFLQ